ncbi:MAG: FkbM family methyltransferase [Sphingopyxis macrogoltabida]|uniref:FkbM family methyltransferase n=1 Tax=Sphingopyxis macrogoltabida TaxID=33050 RepID=A0A2W5MU17_SPHMC|nr:MAG: FkbM family methyltransferase [Sphingopyxis macrogoltabida]
MTPALSTSPLSTPSPIAAFLDYGVKKTLHKWAARAASKVARRDGRDVVTSRYGVRMRANWRDRTFQYCRYATYGRVLSGYLAAQERPFGFVDIGANQGLYSLLAARNPQCVGVTAFEPVAATFALLRDNIALNGAEAHIRPVHAAVSLQSGMATIATDTAHSGVASLRDTAATGVGEDIRILGITGVDTLLPPDAPLIVKIDVEGHEETVVEALIASMHRDRIASLFYEVDSRWTDAAAIESRLRAAGFGRFDRFGIGRHYDILARRAATT